MIKKLFVIIILLTPYFAQEGITVIDEQSNKAMLLGRHDRSAFADSSFASWYNEEFESYIVDDSTLAKLRDSMKEIKTTLVMGTWCSDSRREVPHFYKIVDNLGYDEKNVELICVDRAKVGVSDEVDGLDIELVPTFIFYRDGTEIGRIIESPNETLELDLSKILK